MQDSEREIKRQEALLEKMACSCRSVVFFHSTVECKKLKICVYFCDGYREFFSLCLIRECEEEGWGEKTEECGESMCLGMFVLSIT